MQTKFCNKCGNTINDGEKFCRKCGNRISSMQGNMPIVNNSYQQENPEGTVILGGVGQNIPLKSPVKRGTLVLSFEEMLRGCSKVVDFGTGKRYEISIPPGLNPSDVIKVTGTGIIDPGSGMEYEIELTTIIG